MSITTYTQFVTRLGDIEITGVTRRLDGPPAALNTADLPTSWVAFPEGEEGPITSDGTHGGWPTFRGDLIIAYEAVGQGQQTPNFTGTLTIMDNVAAALRGNYESANRVAKGKVTWTIRGGFTTVAVGRVEYWCVVASVVGHG